MLAVSFNTLLQGYQIEGKIIIYMIPSATTFFSKLNISKITGDIVFKKAFYLSRNIVAS